jgi:hypothetical protein
MDSNDYLSVNHILAEVSMACGDKDFRNGFSKGWYVSRIQDALQEAALDTFYYKITDDFDIPANLNIAMPDNSFNIRMMIAYTGDCCVPSKSAVIHWKRNYNNKKKVDGALTRHQGTGKSNTSDPIIPSTRNVGNLYYAGIQDGHISFSPAVAQFDKVRITYNGMGVQVGDTPIIPRFFERAVNAYVRSQFWLAKLAEEPRKWRVNYTDAVMQYEKHMEKAKLRVLSMNSFEKESLNEYLSNALHK